MAWVALPKDGCVFFASGHWGLWLPCSLKERPNHGFFHDFFADVCHGVRESLVKLIEKSFLWHCFPFFFLENAEHPQLLFHWIRLFRTKNL